MHQSTDRMTALLLAAALALGSATPSFARSSHAHRSHGRASHVPSPHMRRADANGYFFFPANYEDDYYVYEPRAPRHYATLRESRHHAISRRHRG